MIYIENGPNYHTYTFHIRRDNAPADAPLENLLLAPLPDGTYKEMLITYTLTEAEKAKLQAGLFVDTRGKTEVTRLENGTFNGSSQLARQVCTTSSYSYWEACSGNQQHDGSNYESCPIYQKKEEGTPPIFYTIITTTCLEQNEMIITPIDPPNNGGGSSGGGSGETAPPPATTPPCTTPSVPTNPQPGFTDENGCIIGIPTQPIVKPQTPCSKIKQQREDENFSKRIDTLKTKLTLKKETGYIQKWSGSYEYKDNASATNDANSLSLPNVFTNTYIMGFIHTHVNDYEYVDAEGYGVGKKGIKMFSPADMVYFMDLVKNAKDNGRPLSDVYGIMVSSLGNYQIRFTGNEYQIKTFTNAQKEAFKGPFIDFISKNKKMSLELKFLKFIDEYMNLKGISLYRMNTDGTTEIKLNADKTDIIPINCPK
ncbi:hypothetical protein GSF70_01600 [Flavobacteriaceae bacterium W22]|nr:hypothetical protein [Flavobacteriaceae bacterium W22]